MSKSVKKYIKDLDAKEVVQRLKNGEIMYDDYKKSIELIDGVNVKTDLWDGFKTFGVVFTTKGSWHFLEAKPFEIKKTGCYKTRGGKKAFVHKQDDDYNYWYFVVDGDFDRWKCSHKGFVSVGEQSKNDITEEWSDDE